MTATAKRAFSGLPRTDSVTAKASLLVGKAAGIPDRKITERTCRVFGYDGAIYRGSRLRLPTTGTRTV